MKIAQKIIQNNEEIKLDASNIAYEDLQGIARLLGWGVIVESGENENGNYIKFGDGTMVCYYSRNDGDVTFENSQDLWARSDKFYWIYPQPFIETAQFFVTGGGLDSSLLVIGSSNSKTRGEYRWGRMAPFSTSPYTRATGVVSFFAIGKWK